MEKMRFIITILLGSLLACGSPTKSQQVDSEYTISTASESEERAKKVLSTKGKEDLSNILTLKYETPDVPSISEEKEYFANEKYDWIITLESTEQVYFSRDNLSKYFNQNWREKHSYPWLYCIPKGDTKWTFFASSENKADEFSKVAISWKLYDPLEDPPTVYTEEILTKYKKSVSKIAQQLNPNIISENYAIGQAANKSKELSDFVSTNNLYSIMVLKADEEFEGTDIWDVMMSLGLKWGDMDLFHWTNDFQHGDDYLMSVWTSTNPGYFFPEEIAAGRVQTDDLIFGFSIPRSISPDQVLKAMNKSVEYAQSRLGGRILNAEGQPFDMEMESNQINKVIEGMNQNSITPGIGDALYLFQ